MVEQKFFDRVHEMSVLEDNYKEAIVGNGRLIALYGRRRVGKTELVRQFLEKKSKESKLYFYVDLAEKRVVLDALQKAIFEQLKENVIFNDFDDFYIFVKTKSEKEPFILAIDEFQRLLTIAPEAITSLQKHWDLELRKNKIMVLIVGSSIGMMQKITNSKVGALYGRATKIKIPPFKYKDFRLMFKEYSEEEKITRYSVFGGTPYYLEKTIPFKDTHSAIKELILKKDGVLAEEPKNLLEYENVRVHARYNSILQSISAGKEILKEISDYTKTSQTALPPYMAKLEELLDLVQKNDPVLGKERLRRYKICDNFFRFWYKFIFENQTAINLENQKLVEDKIKNELNSYIGKRFEEIIQELLIAYQGKEIKNLRINFDKIGSWWDRNNNEIDILANNSKERTILVGEVKWSSHPIDEIIVDSLLQKSRAIGVSGTYNYLIVSKAGFTEKCQTKMHELKITSLDLKEIEQLFDKINAK